MENTCGTCHARDICFSLPPGYRRHHRDREIKFKSSYSTATFGYVSFCSCLAVRRRSSHHHRATSPPPLRNGSFSQTVRLPLAMRGYFRGRSPPNGISRVYDDVWNRERTRHTHTHTHKRLPRSFLLLAAIYPCVLLRRVSYRFPPCAVRGSVPGYTRYPCIRATGLDEEDARRCRRRFRARTI